VADYGFGNAVIDLNSIPLAAVERIEVLRDGASAIYGADAVAGVINFILRKDYQGAEVSTYTPIRRARAVVRRTTAPWSATAISISRASTSC